MPLAEGVTASCSPVGLKTKATQPNQTGWGSQIDAKCFRHLLFLGYNIRTRRRFWGSVPELSMVRWIAFDDDTAEAVVSRLRRGAAEIQHSVPVDAALRSDGAAVLVLPSRTPGKLLIARFVAHKNALLPPKAERPFPLPVVAQSGLKKAAQSVKQPWWRKLGA